MRFAGRILALAALFITTTLVVLALGPGRALADQAGCQVGNPDPREAWPQGPQTITVIVDLDHSVFASVQQAFTN